jgi:hypothetical protein
MHSRLRPSPAMVIALIALFVSLGGTAAALSGSNTVFSDDIKDNEVRSADVRDDTLSAGGLAAADLKPGSVGTSEAANSSLTGTDIVESSLGEVPSATLGGLGGQSPLSASCDPESTSFTACAAGSIDLPAPSRVLIIGQIRAEPDTGGGNGGGSCGVVSDLAGGLTPIPVFVNGGQTDAIGISGVTDVVGPGPISLGIQCNETASGIRYFNGRVSFVALSPGF